MLKWRAIRAIVISICLYPSLSFAQESGPVAYWSFEQTQGDTVSDNAGRVADRVQGNFSYAEGIDGKGLKFDGFTTRISRSNGLPPIHDAFTFEAWIAPQAYPWNWNAILEQKNRYFFGLDATGHIGLRVFVDDQWRECVSQGAVPFMKWSHVAATFSPHEGLRIYINGEIVGQLQVGGHLDPGEVDPKTGQPTGGKFQIGRNIQELPAAASIKIPASYSFDGIIDEVKIYDRALGTTELKGTFNTVSPVRAPDLKWRKLPIVPDGAGRFGAYYTKLKFYPEWDQLWRIDDYPDVVVTFDQAKYKMVFWHGTGYNMNLVTENGRWIGDQSAEAARSEFGCVEHMSDKQTRYSHVRVLENTPARVVIHWRYALTDVLYNIGEQDPITGWGDWADEYYTIYPDGIAVRHFLVHGPQKSYSITEPATLNNPGERAEDNVSIDAATLANMNGDTRTFSWETWPSDGGIRGDFFHALPDANIAIVNIRSRFKPVYVYEPGTPIIPYGGGASETRPWISKFPIWNHWPVSQIPSDGRTALALDRVSSSAILSPEPPETKRSDEVVEGRFLMGLTDKPIIAALPSARSWLEPPKLTLSGSDFVSDGYSRNDRAYHLRRATANPERLTFHLDATETSPAVNPAIVVDGWPTQGATVKVNGKELKEGSDLRLGYVNHLEGSTLVIWIPSELKGATNILVAIARSPKQ